MIKLKCLENLFPGYFALVMATGIVSMAAFLLKMNFFAYLLLKINALNYIILTVLTIFRLILFPQRFFYDLTDHARGPGFFTLVAGSCVLGVQFLLLASASKIALGLWVIGFAIWFVVMYVFFTAAIVRSPKPTLETGINGAWLLAIVATQSLAVLGVLLTNSIFSTNATFVLFICLCLYLLGSMLYLLIISIIFYRLMFVNVEAKALTPPYWINMGAVAITTLAGVSLIENSGYWDFLQQIEPFLKGFTLFFWSTCTWWIPMLFILGVWRHVFQKEPLVYDPQYWGIVFPLGMYTVCTYRLAEVFGFEFLMGVPRYFVYLPLVAWVTTFAGMITKIVSGFAALFPSRNS